jgi:hypothetical protein
MGQFDDGGRSVVKRLLGLMVRKALPEEAVGSDFP